MYEIRLSNLSAQEVSLMKSMLGNGPEWEMMGQGSVRPIIRALFHSGFADVILEKITANEGVSIKIYPFAKYQTSVWVEILKSLEYYPCRIISYRETDSEGLLHTNTYQALSDYYESLSKNWKNS